MPVASVHGEAPTLLGVCVVICCYNSATLLPQTIADLERQRVGRELREVLVVDNASADSTVEVARQCWGADAPAPMRIVCESRLGLCYARERALEEARYDIIGFVDDDNWVWDSWIVAVAEAFDREGELAGLESLVSPVFAVTPPPWWHEYGADYFALMPEPAQEPLYLNGGFRSQVVGRKPSC